MPTLTKTQIAYATQKIDKLSKLRLSEFRQQLEPRPVTPSYTYDEKLAMIKDGRAVISDPQQTHGGWDVTGFFSYPSTPEMEAAALESKNWEKAISAEESRLSAIKERLLDELVMSPDGVAALEKIAQAFAAP